MAAEPKIEGGYPTDLYPFPDNYIYISHLMNFKILKITLLAWCN